MKLNFDELKAKTRPPIWTFSGIFLAVLAVIGVFIYNGQNDKKIIRYLQSPKVGDIYEVKIRDDVYTLYKVEKIDNDTIYFFANKYEANLEGISDLQNKEFDEQKVYRLPKSTLMEMNKDDKINDIDRD